MSVAWQVIRIERGVRYLLTANRELTSSEIAAIGGEVHDRMTEVVLSSESDIGGLFRHASPKPVCTRTGARGSDICVDQHQLPTRLLLPWQSDGRTSS